MSQPPNSTRPPLLWRIGSTAVVTSIAAISRAFLVGLNNVEVNGLENLLHTIDKRKSPGGKQRGLITVCNHVAVLDDPLLWGILPIKYAVDVCNVRWGLGAHDICFRNRLTSTFFSLGQVLPTHRLWHSSHGGLYQPSMAEAVRLLSGPSSSDATQPKIFSTTGRDAFVAPSQFASNRHAWVHVFPEACCHQQEDASLRYFKWGISRLILESEPAPDFIPIFAHGLHRVMPENRGWPRWAPRVGNRIRFAIGEVANVDELFGDYRAAWRELAAKKDPNVLQQDPEAVRLRIEVAKTVRYEVEKLRQDLGFSPEKDDGAAFAETWADVPRNKRQYKTCVGGDRVNRP